MFGMDVNDFLFTGFSALDNPGSMLSSFNPLVNLNYIYIPISTLHG